MKLDPRVLRVIGSLLHSIADQMDGGMVVIAPPRQVTKVRSKRIS